MRVRERCACGGSIDVEADRPGDAVESWRSDHTCDRRQLPAGDVTGAQVEPVERGPVGFTVQP